MSYQDYHIKTTDEAEFIEHALLHGIYKQDVTYDEEGNETPSGDPYPAEGMSVDVIGTIYDIDNTDPENPVSTSKEGFHVNIRTKQSLTLCPSCELATPTTPYRVFAS